MKVVLYYFFLMFLGLSGVNFNKAINNRIVDETSPVCHLQIQRYKCPVCNKIVNSPLNLYHHYGKHKIDDCSAYSLVKIYQQLRDYLKNVVHNQEKDYQTLIDYIYSNEYKILQQNDVLICFLKENIKRTLK